MAIRPVVRYMLLCDDWHADPDKAKRITIVGLVNSVGPRKGDEYPILIHQMCVFLLLTDGYGGANWQVVCVDDETGMVVHRSAERFLEFAKGPLDVVGVPVRIQDLVVPRPGSYTVEFWYDGQVVEERSFRAR
jgi:hypothetical protein